MITGMLISRRASTGMPTSERKRRSRWGRRTLDMACTCRKISSSPCAQAGVAAGKQVAASCCNLQVHQVHLSLPSAGQVMQLHVGSCASWTEICLPVLITKAHLLLLRV